MSFTTSARLLAFSLNLGYLAHHGDGLRVATPLLLQRLLVAVDLAVPVNVDALPATTVDRQSHVLQGRELLPVAAQKRDCVDALRRNPRVGLLLFAYLALQPGQVDDLVLVQLVLGGVGSDPILEVAKLLAKGRDLAPCFTETRV